MKALRSTQAPPPPPTLGPISLGLDGNHPPFCHYYYVSPLTIAVGQDLLPRIVGSGGSGHEDMLCGGHVRRQLFKLLAWLTMITTLTLGAILYFA